MIRDFIPSTEEPGVRRRRRLKVADAAPAPYSIPAGDISGVPAAVPITADVPRSISLEGIRALEEENITGIEGNIATLVGLVLQEVEVSIRSHPAFMAEYMIRKVARDVATQGKANKSAIDRMPQSALRVLALRIANAFWRAKTDSGVLVGVRAAHSLGEKFTQGALNTFHMAGNAAGRKEVSALVRAKELTDATLLGINPTMDIHFRNLSTASEIRRMIPLVQYRVVGDFITAISVVKLGEDGPWWRELQQKVRRVRVRPSSVLRIKFDSQMLYTWRLAMGDLASLIESQVSEKLKTAVKILHSPLKEGVMEVYANPSEMSSGTTLDAYLKRTIAPEVKAVNIGGIADVEEVYPASTLLISALGRPRQTSGGVVFNLDTLKMKRYDITIAQLNRLLQVKTTMTIDENGFMATDKTADEVNAMVTSVHVLLSDLHAENFVHEEDVDAETLEAFGLPADAPSCRVYLVPKLMAYWEVDLDDLPFPAYVKHDDGLTIYGVSYDTYAKQYAGMWIFSFLKQKVNHHWYLTTYGINMHGAFGVPEINENTVVSSSPVMIAQTLGIEAARGYLYQEYLNTVAVGVHPSHVSLVCDIMCRQGIVISMTRTGNVMRNSGPLTTVGFEKNTEMLFQVASVGEYDPLTSSNASVIMGLQMDVGTSHAQVTYPGMRTAPKARVIPKPAPKLALKRRTPSS